MDEAKLRDRLARLERLASDRNPNAHEREVARRKAAELRARLPQRKEHIDPLVERLRAAAQAQEQARKATATHADAWKQAREMRQARIEERVNYLNKLTHRLKPSGQLFASDLCAQWYTKGWLSEKQLKCVEQLINEAEGN